MAQRGWLNLREGIFRISIPGVDVKSAQPDQLLLDERILYPQLLQTLFIAYNSAQPTVWVGIPDYGFVPRAIAFARIPGENNRSFPTNAQYTGSAGSNLQNHFFFGIYQNSVFVDFAAPSGLVGAQIILLRPL